MENIVTITYSYFTLLTVFFHEHGKSLSKTIYLREIENVVWKSKKITNMPFVLKIRCCWDGYLYLESGIMTLVLESSLKFVKLCDANFDSESWLWILFTLYKRTRIVHFWMHLLIATLTFIYFLPGTALRFLQYQCFAKTNNNDDLSRNFRN